jgi:t-SNARE complex subunit (syntaxin)
MINFSKELVDPWTVEQLEKYIDELEERVSDTNKWIKYLKALRKKKTRKSPVDTGARDGR